MRNTNDRPRLTSFALANPSRRAHAGGRQGVRARALRVDAGARAIDANLRSRRRLAPLDLGADRGAGRAHGPLAPTPRLPEVLDGAPRAGWARGARRGARRRRRHHPCGPRLLDRACKPNFGCPPRAEARPPRRRPPPPALGSRLRRRRAGPRSRRTSPNRAPTRASFIVGGALLAHARARRSHARKLGGRRPLRRRRRRRGRRGRAPLPTKDRDRSVGFGGGADRGLARRHGVDDRRRWLACGLLPAIPELVRSRAPLATNALLPTPTIHRLDRAARAAPWRPCDPRRLRGGARPPRSATAAAREALSEYGNCSSVSIFQTLERALGPRFERGNAGDAVLFSAFGPGFSAEVLLGSVAKP